ncbi:MAG: glycosyltransferase, partial [Anaerolineae bacterium]
YFKSFMPGIKTVVIGNGICKTRFGPDLLTEEEKDQTRKTLGLQPSDKVILYVGRMAKEKRVLELFHVLIPLLQEQPQCKALFVGSGPSLEAMIRAAERSNLQNQVTFTGTVDWEQIHRLYSIADVFVTASLSEVHPMTLLEASTCGLPIIARRDDSCIDLVEDDCNGYLVDSDRQIATKLSETVNDENRLLAFSKNALFWADRFSAKAHVEKLESLYQQIKGLNHAQDRVHRCR